MILELEVEAACEVVVVHNVQHVAGVERLGIRAGGRREFLSVLLTGEYLDDRARRGSREKFDRVLVNVRDVAPEGEDRS